MLGDGVLLAWRPEDSERLFVKKADKSPNNPNCPSSGQGAGHPTYAFTVRHIHAPRHTGVEGPRAAQSAVPPAPHAEPGALEGHLAWEDLGISVGYPAKGSPSELSPDTPSIQHLSPLCHASHTLSDPPGKLYPWPNSYSGSETQLAFLPFSTSSPG